MLETSGPDNAQSRLRSARRVVLKVGSALLMRPHGALDAAWLAALADDIAALKSGGCEVIVVTSGSIAIGRNRLGLGGKLRLAEKQAAAAAGQAHLINAWQAALARHDLIAAQLLLTLDDTEDRRRYLNARATLNALLALNAIPVVNENDTVATAEIRYGDNDRLSAHTAQMAGADLLILLSDIDGLYTADPRAGGAATHVPFVDEVTAEIEAMAGAANPEAGVGAGGMATKVAAAKIASNAGCAVIIARGDSERPLQSLLEGARATVFAPHSTPDRARRAWISGRLKPAGGVTIDDGALAALNNGASLLPAGIVAVTGDFRRGDAVSIIDAQGVLVGQGLSAYDAAEVEKLKGKKSLAIEEILGYRGAVAIIHRDDLALGGRPRKGN